MYRHKPGRAGALKQIFQFALILVFLSSFIIISPIQTTNAKGEEQAPLPNSSIGAPLFAPGDMANVSINAPATAMLGANVSFSVDFDNDSATTGYGPFIEVALDRTGADGVEPGTPVPANTYDGLSTNSTISASYLGTPITASDIFVVTFNAAGNLTHPLMRNASGAFVVVNAAAYGAAPGDKLIVVRLPFGSFTPAQPTATIDMTVNMSDLADIGTGLFINARGGYQYGTTPIDDWCCGDVASATLGTLDLGNVTPTLFTLAKTFSGPEGETATGPNFPRTYTVTATIAAGQTISNLTLTDVLPDNVQFVSMVTPSAASCPSLPASPSTSTPGGTLNCNFASASGTVTMTYTFYVPELYDADSDTFFDDPVLDPVTGNDANSCNNASITAGTWTAVDSRDSNVDLSTTPYDPAGCETTHVNKSIAIQKGLAGIPGPGNTFTYTLSFEVSDFFSFDDVTITDVISDGQRLDTTFTPTLQVNGNGYTIATGNFAAANYDVNCYYTPVAGGGTGAECETSNPVNSGNPDEYGTTQLVFHVSDQIDVTEVNGFLLGGCVDTTGGLVTPCDASGDGDGPTTGTIVFRTTVQERFADNFPSGDESVDQGDLLGDHVTIDGDVLDNTSFTPVGTEDDVSAASTTIPTGTLTKSIYAVNGSTSFGSPVLVKPGDTVTYRIQYDMPISDEENLELTDYLPLPVFHVDDPEENGIAGPAWTFDPTVSAAVPAAGVAKFGPADTFFPYSGIIPVLASSTPENRLTFTYGDFDDPANTSTMVDLLFTVTVSDDPFADGLYLTNEAHAFEGSTNGGLVTANAIIQIVLTEPVLVSTKSVVATNNPNATISPAIAGPILFNAPGSAYPRWSGDITSSYLDANPINGNISGIDAGDLITFAIVIENTGSSLNGAFDIILKDTLPAQFQIPAGGPNLQAAYGDHDAGAQPQIGYAGQGVGCTSIWPGDPCGPDGIAGNADDFFGTGVQLVDPIGSGVCQAHNPNSGRNVILVTFDLQAIDAIPPGTFTNTSALTNYAGTEGGPNHLAEDQEDTATSTVVTSFNKALVGTEVVSPHNANNQVVIGELVTYRMTVTVPEGLVPNVVLADTLDGGLAFVDVTSFVVSNPDLDGSFPFDTGISYSGSSTPVIGVGGQTITFNLGDITNTDRDNTVAETITIEYRAVVLNVAGNQGVGSPLTATLLNNAAVYSWTGGSRSSSAANVTVIESAITTTKTVSPASADAGDTVSYTVTLTNTGGSGTDAFDVTWIDTVPTGLTYTGSSLQIGVCDASTVSNSVNDSLTPILTASLSNLAYGASCEITFDVTVDYAVSPLQVITNTATTSWTSLDSTVVNTYPRSTYNSNSTERTGAGGVNDYSSPGSVDVTVNNVNITKQITATSVSDTTGSIVIIGEEITYAILLAFPEGLTPTDTVVDDLPSGLEVVPGSPEIITTATGSGGLLTVDFSGTIGTQNITEVPGNGGSVTFNFANVGVPADNNPTNNTLLMRFRARVTSSAIDQDEGTLSNAATSQVGTETPISSNIVNVTIQRLVKSLINSNIASTTPNEVVTIGEIVTYQIVLTLPPDTTDTAVITDTLDSGLAFVDCSEISRSNASVTSSLVSFTGPGNCNPAITNTDANPINEGSIITFDLGDIGNTDTAVQTITLTYRVIVLDIASNVQNVTLDNNVVWTSTGGTLSRQGTPSLRIVEPDLEIEKSVDPEVAEFNSIVTFTIDISHTDASLATAYDVIVTDGIPTGLALVPGSIQVTETNNPVPPGGFVVESPTQFSVYWSEFPLLATARITFRATYVGPGAVINTASVVWSSLQLDPAPDTRATPFVPQSTFNDFSTERRYDPLNPAGINNYRVASTARVSIPERLPRTGFAPGKVTILPEQPDYLAYAALGDLWLEIPKLAVKKDIVGVPFEEKDWNLTWLGSQAGYLAGSAYPTHNGNSALTAHAYLADGTPGPFAKLNTLSYGDQIIVHLGGQKYIYEVRENLRVRPDNTSVLKHEEKSWLTLITCQTYNEQTKDYIYRIAVRAVLVKVE